MFRLFLSYLRRYHTHVVCHKGDNNLSCLLGEATCVENVVQRELTKQDLKTEFLQFTTSCSCEVINGSSFINILWKFALSCNKYCIYFKYICGLIFLALVTQQLNCLWILKIQQNRSHHKVLQIIREIIRDVFNPLSANAAKWSNTLKHFVADELFLVCLTILWGWRFKR